MNISGPASFYPLPAVPYPGPGAAPRFANGVATTGATAEPIANNAAILGDSSSAQTPETIRAVDAPVRSFDAEFDSESDSESESESSAQSEARPNANPDPNQLSEEEQRQLQELQVRDREVRAHEQAHVAAGGSLVVRGAVYEYETGPDGQRYAVGGEVKIDASPGRTPEETVNKAQRIVAAALAPADPSPQDRKVASDAQRMAAEARVAIAREASEQSSNQASDQASNQGSDQASNMGEESSKVAASNDSALSKAPSFGAEFEWNAIPASASASASAGVGAGVGASGAYGSGTSGSGVSDYQRLSMPVTAMGAAVDYFI